MKTFVYDYGNIDIQAALASFIVEHTFGSVPALLINRVKSKILTVGAE